MHFWRVDAHPKHLARHVLKHDAQRQGGFFIVRMKVERIERIKLLLERPVSLVQLIH